jgi:hypothetical protein
MKKHIHRYSNCMEEIKFEVTRIPIGIYLPVFKDSKYNILAGFLSLYQRPEFLVNVLKQLETYESSEDQYSFECYEDTCISYVGDNVEFRDLELLEKHGRSLVPLVLTITQFKAILDKWILEIGK